MESTFLSGYESLANGIIIQVCKDYRTLIKRIQAHPCDSFAKNELAQLENFFHSEWYQVLTSVDGDYLMQRIKDEEVMP